MNVIEAQFLLFLLIRFILFVINLVAWSTSGHALLAVPIHPKGLKQNSVSLVDSISRWTKWMLVGMEKI